MLQTFHGEKAKGLEKENDTKQSKTNSVFFAFAKATHIFFSKNTCELDIVLTNS